MSKQSPFRSPAQWLAHFAGSIIIGVWWGSLFIGAPLLAVIGLLYGNWANAWTAYAFNIAIVTLVVERLAYAGAKTDSPTWDYAPGTMPNRFRPGSREWHEHEAMLRAERDRASRRPKS